MHNSHKFIIGQILCHPLIACNMGRRTTTSVASALTIIRNDMLLYILFSFVRGLDVKTWMKVHTYIWVLSTGGGVGGSFPPPPPNSVTSPKKIYSDLKLIKTRLRSRMGEETLEHTMRICIKGPECLTNETLEEIIENYKRSRKKK